MNQSQAALPDSRVAIWILAARPKTLWAAVAPVVLGTAMALEAGAAHGLAALFALLAAVLIQVGTNYSNDYHDFKKGADTSARKGPLRVTQAGLVRPEHVRRAAMLAFGLAFVVGLYLIWRGGWPILVVGLLSILFGLLYTAGRYSLAYLGVADLFVLVFFGPVAVGGTYFVQATALPKEVILAGFGPGFLATAILLVNNIRDVDEDRAAGKRTIVVRFGRPLGVRLYVLCVLAATILPIVLSLHAGAHFWSMSAALVAIPGMGVARRLRMERDGARLNPLLGSTARLLLIYCLLFGAGWNL